MALDRKRVLEPLGMRCTDTQCDQGLHYFKPTKKHKLGPCRKCGDVPPIDWPRLHSRRISDMQYTVDSLQHECARDYMWHVRLDPNAINKARSLGLGGIRDAAERRLRTKAFSGIPHPVYDGRQTPTSGNLIFYAQHATGTCCRKCMQYWHGIELDRMLTEQDVAFLLALIMYYCQWRLEAPSLLADEGAEVAHERAADTK